MNPSSIIKELQLMHDDFEDQITDSGLNEGDRYDFALSAVCLAIKKRIQRLEKESTNED